MYDDFGSLNKIIWHKFVNFLWREDEISWEMKRNCIGWAFRMTKFDDFV
jgi:hypothetical protein